MLYAMEKAKPLPEPAPSFEPEFTEREKELIAEAEADFAAGRFVEWEQIEAWWEATNRGQDIPTPQGHQRF